MTIVCKDYYEILRLLMYLYPDYCPYSNPSNIVYTIKLHPNCHLPGSLDRYIIEILDPNFKIEDLETVKILIALKQENL